LVAKVASDQAKPRGLLWSFQEVKRVFSRLYRCAKFRIGEVTERALRALRIETVEQLASQPLEKLEKVFGSGHRAVPQSARRRLLRIRNRCEPKSISHNHTFEKTRTIRRAHTMLITFRKRPASAFAKQPGHAHSYAHHSLHCFDTYTRSKTLGEPAQLDADIFAAFQKLFHANRNHRRKIRLLGVSLAADARAKQLDLLPPNAAPNLKN